MYLNWFAFNHFNLLPFSLKIKFSISHEAFKSYFRIMENMGPAYNFDVCVSVRRALGTSRIGSQSFAGLRLSWSVV